jgi:antitoxin ParD1/3/4
VKVTTTSAKLGPQLEGCVTELVKSARYGSRSEVLREGVRLVAEREKRLAALDAAIRRGISDIEAGRTHTLEDVEAELIERYGGQGGESVGS